MFHVSRPRARSLLLATCGTVTVCAAATSAAGGGRESIELPSSIVVERPKVEIPIGCVVEDADRTNLPVPAFTFLHADDSISCHSTQNFRGTWVRYKTSYDDKDFDWKKVTDLGQDFFEPAAGDVDGDNVSDLAGTTLTGKVGFASAETQGFQEISGIPDGTFSLGKDVPAAKKIVGFKSWDVDGDGFRDLLALRTDWSVTVAILEPQFDPITLDGRVTGRTPKRQVKLGAAGVLQLAPKGAPAFSPTRWVVGKMAKIPTVPDKDWRLGVIGVDDARSPKSTIQFGYVDAKAGQVVYDASVRGAENANPAAGGYFMSVMKIEDIALTDEPTGGTIYGVTQIGKPTVASDNNWWVFGMLHFGDKGIYDNMNWLRNGPAGALNGQLVAKPNDIDSVRIAVGSIMHTLNAKDGSSYQQAEPRAAVRVVNNLWEMNGYAGGWKSWGADCDGALNVHDFAGLRETIRFSGGANATTVAPYAWKPHALLIPPPCWTDGYQQCGTQEAANAGYVTFGLTFSAGQGQQQSTTTTASVTDSRHYGISANFGSPIGSGSFGASMDFDNSWSNTVTRAQLTSQDWSSHSNILNRRDIPIVVYEKTCAIDYWYMHRRGHKRDGQAQFQPVSDKGEDLLVLTRVKAVGTVLDTARLDDYNLQTWNTQKPQYMIGVCSDMTLGADGVPEPKALKDCAPHAKGEAPPVVVPHVYGVPWTYYRAPLLYEAKGFPTLNGRLLSEGEAASQGAMHPALQAALDAAAQNAQGWLAGIPMSNAGQQTAGCNADRHVQDTMGAGKGHDKSEGWRVSADVPIAGFQLAGNGGSVNVQFSGGRTRHTGVTENTENFSSRRNGYGSDVQIAPLDVESLKSFHSWDWQTIGPLKNTTQAEFQQTQLRVYPYVYHYTMGKGGQVTVVDYKIVPTADLWAYPYRWKWDGTTESRVQDKSDGTVGATSAGTYRVGGQYCDKPIDGKRIITVTRGFGGVVVKTCQGKDVCKVPVKRQDGQDVPMWGTAECGAADTICRVDGG